MRKRVSWSKTNPEANRLAQRRWHARNPHVRREYWWKEQGIKITWDQYVLMQKEQGHVCAICGGTSKRQLHVDHDHKTGLPRKLLCANCNQGIGHFKESPELMQKAILYLREYV